MYELATHIFHKLSHTIVALYALTLTMVVIGTAFALNQNWLVRLEATQMNLVRNANISNVLIEGTVISAHQTLRTTRNQIELALLKAPLSHSEIHQILKNAVRASNAYRKSYELGLMFYVDALGYLYALSDRDLSHPIDMSDRFYYTDLRNNYDKSSTVGPLLKARTTGQWVFHMSIPVHDGQGIFTGVLVQQMLASAISADLARSTNTSDFEQMTTTYPGRGVTIIYSTTNGQTDNADLNNAIARTPKRLSEKEGAFTWKNIETNDNELILIGYAQSTLMGLVSYVKLPMRRVWQKFLQDNLILISYALVSALFISAFFIYLYRLSQELALAQVNSTHDVLTGLNNRRALEEQLPILLRESMRQQSPITVMFIDIDHFRIFNERYGHESGDVALKALANTLARVYQRPLDFICRWGGEEFVAILPNTNATAAKKLALDILQATRALQLHVPHHAAPHLTVSIGHISSTITGDTLGDDLVDAADQAMLQAKHQGRNQSVMVRPTQIQHYTHMTFAPISNL